MNSPVTLASDYYLDNFLKLIDHALHWYPDLLKAEEQQWITLFNQLDKPSQCLLVRLYSRRGCWFRTDKLRYTEIPDLTQSLTTLAAKQFISINPSMDVHLLSAALLTKPEVCALYPEVNKSLKKEQLIASIPNTEFTEWNKLGFDVIQLNSDHMIDLLLTLFFANTHQDLSQFVLDDLGLHQFEQYELSQERRFFSSRQQIEQLLTLSALAESYALADRKNTQVLDELYARIPPPIEHKYIERKRQHMLNDIARDYERQGEYDTALSLFRQTPLPPSRERQARILDKLNQDDLFCDVVTEILTHPTDVVEHEVATKLQQKLLRKQGIKMPRVAKPTLDEYRLELDLSNQKVELASKAYFEAQGWTVYFAENHFLNGLLGLAFWDVFFAPVEGAFINAYQFKPLDLYHADFLSKRQPLVDDVFAHLAKHGLSHLQQKYTQKFNISNPLIHWGAFDPEMIDFASHTMPIETLIELFKVQLSDIKLYRNGMPDLIAFKGDQYRWIEVKGPGDKLQDNQWRWIAQFQRLGVLFAVCYVNQ